jgi:hypothetical protein
LTELKPSSKINKLQKYFDELESILKINQELKMSEKITTVFMDR